MPARVLEAVSKADVYVMFLMSTRTVHHATILCGLAYAHLLKKPRLILHDAARPPPSLRLAAPDVDGRRDDRRRGRRARLRLGVPRGRGLALRGDLVRGDLGAEPPAVRRDDLPRLHVSCHDIAAVWVAFFSRWQR